MEDFKKNITPEDTTSEEVVNHGKKVKKNVFEQVSLLQLHLSVQLKIFVILLKVSCRIIYKISCLSI